MRQAQVGIIGGTGLGDALAKEMGQPQRDPEPRRDRKEAYCEGAVLVDTPFGPPSSPPILANWEGVDVAFLARHGPGHRFNPSTVPYRANIWALKELGVSAIIASGAVGSLRERIKPGHLVLCDQVIDKTFRRPATFFDEGIVAHVECADPFCPRLRALLAEAGKRVDTTVHERGTYVCMEGPQFSTRAESHMHRAWGGDMVGMTCMPEAKLAREAEICYAMIGLPTDYDCWRLAGSTSVVDASHGVEPARTTANGGSAPAEDKSRNQDALLEEILANLRRATDNAVALIHEPLKLLKPEPRASARADGSEPMASARAEQSSTPQAPLVSCACHDSLKLAIWSDLSAVDPAILERLDPLIGRYLRNTGPPA
jgi:5'-methylthioadenosine phosphorylase